MQTAFRANTPQTEVEIKLRLPNKEAHDKVEEVLKTSHRETHEQENYFFDGPAGEMNAQRVVLRCRFYNVDKRALLTCKGQQVISGGIGRGSEEEHDIDPREARAYLEEPSKLLKLNSQIMQRLVKQFNLKELVCQGGFRNVRKDFDWNHLKLELDETKFDWGTVYEIEVETPEPEAAKDKLEALLKEHGVSYAYNTTTKYANFRNRSLI